MESAIFTDTPTPASRAVLMALAWFNNDKTGRCFPSHRALAERGQVDVRSVPRALKVLVDAGLIRIHTAKGKTNTASRPTDAYALDFHRAYWKDRKQSQQAGEQGGPDSLYEGPDSVHEGPDRESRELRTELRIELKDAQPRDGGSELQLEQATPESPAQILTTWVERIWKAIPNDGDSPEAVTPRKRTKSKADMANALKAAVHRGKDPARIWAALINYYAEPNQMAEGRRYAAGAQRIIAGDRWETWDAGPERTAQMLAACYPANGVVLAAPVDELGTLERPGPRRQRSWMGDYRDNPAKWRPERGPAPGQRGCRISAEIQREFGVQPHGQREEGAPR